MALTKAFTSAGQNKLAVFREVGDQLTHDQVSGISRILAAEHEVLLGQMSGNLEGEMARTHLASIGTRTRFEQQEEDRKNARFSDAVLLALLDDLDAQIAELEGQIRDYDKQIAAVEWLIENHKIIDPNDPDHRELLRLAGIPEDEWGTVTVEELKERLEELKAAKNEASAELNKIRNEKDFWAEKKDQYDLRKAADPNYDRDGSIARDINSRFNEVFIENIKARPASIEAETAWFKAVVKELEIYHGHTDYMLKMGELVSSLSANTKAELISDVNISNDVLTQLHVDRFFNDYERAQSRRDDPRYGDMLEKKLVGRLDENAKAFLKNHPSTSDEVLQIINKMENARVDSTNDLDMTS